MVLRGRTEMRDEVVDGGGSNVELKLQMAGLKEKIGELSFSISNLCCILVLGFLMVVLFMKLK